MASRPVATTTVIQIKRDLPAYTRITATDIITVATVSSPPVNAMNNMSDVVGMITIYPLKQGAILVESAFVPLPQLNQEWLLLSIPISPISRFTHGETVIIFGYDSGKGVAIEISRQAVIIDIQSEQAILALPSKEAHQVIPYLALEHKLTIAHSLD